MKRYSSFDSYLRSYIDATLTYTTTFLHYQMEATATDPITVCRYQGDAYLEMISCDDRLIPSTPDIFLHLPHDPEALHATTTIFIQSLHEDVLSTGEAQLPVVIGAGQEVKTQRLWNDRGSVTADQRQTSPSNADTGYKSMLAETANMRCTPILILS